jgi:hypothetical protein
MICVSGVRRLAVGALGYSSLLTFPHTWQEPCKQERGIMTKTGERILIGVSVALLIALYVSQAVWGGARHDFGPVPAVDVERSEQ